MTDYKNVAEEIVDGPVRVKRKNLLNPFKPTIYLVEEFEPGFVDKVLETGKKVAAGGIVIAASYFLADAALADGKADQPKPKTNLEMEYEFKDNKGADEQKFRLELGEPGKGFRVEHTNADVYKNRAGAKLELSKLYSNLDIFGTNNSEGNWGAGLNLDGELKLNPNLLFGIIAEKANQLDTETLLEGLYLGLKEGGTILKLGGYKQTENHDQTDILSGVLFQELGKRHILGIGGGRDSKENLRLNFVLGNWPEKDGKGPAYRVLGNTNLEGDFNLGLMFALGAKYNVWTHKGPMNITGGGMNDVSLVDNIMDWVTPFPGLHEYTDGLAALEIKFKHKNHRTDTLVDTAIYPGRVLEELGLKNPAGKLIWVGGGYDTADHRLTGKMGLYHKGLNIYAIKKEGEGIKVFALYKLKF